MQLWEDTAVHAPRSCTTAPSQALPAQVNAQLINVSVYGEA